MRHRGGANMGANTVRSGWAALLASAAVLIPMAAIEANAGAFAVREQSTVGQGDAFAGGGAGNTGSPALLFSGYSTYQVNPNLWLGLSINTPFGLSTNFNDPWAGRN